MKKLCYSLALFLSVSVLSHAQSTPLSDLLPMDPAVKVGKLPNGLTYYIRKNEEPKDRAELRLVIKAGSILETEEQRGLAHFLEHMNFNGTKNFPKNELVNFLEKSGIKFGADLNAYTSFDETVYMLPVPSDNLEQLEKYLSVLADWSGNATLDPEEIDKERGVVLEEARLRKGASQRINEKLYPVLFRNSRYANRLPIGLDHVIQNAPYSEFRKFKDAWYRPDLQAIVAVGDFDPATVEAMIIRLFSDFVNPENAQPRPSYSVPLNGGTDAIVITDKEQPYSMVQLFYLQPERKERTLQDRKEGIVKSLFNSMISRRLSELQQSEHPPFQFGMSGYSSFLAGLDALNVVAVARGNDVEKALIAVLDENTRAARFGFTAGELDRAKRSYLASIEKQYAEKDKTGSSSYVNELVQCFLDGVVMTDIAFDKAFVDQYLGQIQLEEINAFAKQVLTPENRVLALMGPESAKSELPTEDRLKQLLDNTGSDIKAYVDEEVVASLVEVKPQPGKIVSEKQTPSLGVTEIVFENGIKVHLKPTSFKNDEVILRGFRWGGTSLYPDVDADHAALAAFVASNSGNGKLTRLQLTKYLSGKVANVNVAIGSIVETVQGGATVKDLETALQMVYNKFTSNHLDKSVVRGALSNQRDLLANQEANPTPEKVFSDTLQTLLTNYHPRARPMTSQRWAEIDPERSMAIFKERMGDAAGYEFVVVGSFDIAEIKPLLATYIGSLPSTKKEHMYKDLKILPPSGKVSKTVRRGVEDKANVMLLYSGTYAPDAKSDLLMDALGQMLKIKLTEKLREEEGGVYSPSVRMQTSRYPSGRYELAIGFGCAPDNVEKLIALAQEEVARLGRQGADPVDIEKYVNNEKLNLQTQLKTNGYWVAAMVDKLMKKENMETILSQEAALDMVTVESTKALAQQYLSGENFIRAVLLPEKE